jgi:hypothetical protein
MRASQKSIWDPLGLAAIPHLLLRRGIPFAKRHGKRFSALLSVFVVAGEIDGVLH